MANHHFYVDSFVRFHNYVRIMGGLHSPGEVVKSLNAFQSGVPVGSGQVNLPTFGHKINARFVIAFISDHFDAKELLLVFEFENGTKFEVTGSEAVEIYRRNEAATNQAEKKFYSRLKTPGYDRVLEIGSRARSGLIRRQLFEGKEYTGIDVLDGPNVDVVGDAHLLSAHLRPESFDAVYSISTFEHLAMPWKVAIELNKVLRTGGIAYLSTHQALGMHDMPWDFWRFSDTAWDAIFNTFTGFRKEATFLGSPMTVVPNVYHDHWQGYEGAVGYAISAVMIEKIGPTTLTWDLDMKKAIRGIYPQ
jgi:hypothetical protein